MKKEKNYLFINNFSKEKKIELNEMTSFRRVYHIVTDNAFRVESIVTYHQKSRQKCIA